MPCYQYFLAWSLPEERRRAAENLYLEAAAVFEREGMTEELATSANQLAWLYRARGRLEEAIRYCHRALAFWKTSLGEDHPRVADSTHMLATLYFRLGMIERAEAWCRQALARKKRILGERHQGLDGLLELRAAIDRAMMPRAR